MTRVATAIKVGESAIRWGKVANVVFQGASALALDAKGRLTVPARHREVLQALCNGQLTLTKHPEGCLMVFPRPAWEQFRDRVAALPMSAAGWKRVFLGNAQDVEIDSAARVLVAPELRAAAGLQKDVMLLGMGSHFELWDAQAYATHEAAVMQSELPDALKDFSF
ncbi:MraZ protein [Roseateles sp. YR242]|nr:MraZ protein [Roseateles sp. YR242]